MSAHLCRREPVPPLRRAWLRLKRWHLLNRHAHAAQQEHEMRLTAEQVEHARRDYALLRDALRIQIDDIGLALDERA